MKTTVATWSRVLHCMRIVCTNGLVIRLAEYPHDLLISGNTYKSDSGYQFSGVEAGSTLSPGSVDLSSIIGLSENVTIATIQAGIFDKASVYVFATDWANPVEDEEPIFKGVFGKITIEDNRYTVAIMNLLDLLSATVGESYSATCSLRFGGQEFGGCKVDKVALQVTGTITGVTNNYNFSDSARSEADDFFGYGEIWFTSGDNFECPSQRVKDFTLAGGLIETSEPFPFLPQIGDTYIMQPGCRGRQADCFTKYNNIARRRAFQPPGERFMRLVGGL
jgi:uncharacterized phage protein (TIGR02218 family)